MVMTLSRGLGLRSAIAIVVATAVAPGCGGGTGGVSRTLGDVDLLVKPSSISFKSVAVNTELTAPVTISHVGTSGVVRLTGFEIDTKSPEGVFWFDEPEDRELTVGESTTLVVHYKPKVASTPDEGTLIIRHDVPDKSAVRVSITTLGGFAELAAIPNPIDFGEVENAAEVAPKDVRLVNEGTQPLTIEQIVVDPDGSDFAIQGGFVIEAGGEGLPAELAPRAGLGLVVAYDPKGGDCDDAFLSVKLAGEEDPVLFPIAGCELSPKLVVSPGVVDFGYVQPGQAVSRKLMLSNEGRMDLRLDKIAPTVGTDPAVTVSDLPPAGYLLVPQASVEITVGWTAGSQTSDDLGGIQVESNDPTSPLVLQVFGVVDAPQIVLVPDDLVDFGFVAISIVAGRTVTVRNDGHGTLDVTNVRVDGDTLGEFTIEGDTAFGVEGYATHPINLKFKNKGQKGEVNAQLCVQSNDPAKPETCVAMKANRADKATCTPVLIPKVLNFGMVAMGYSKTLAFTVKNTGSGNCTFLTARVADCMGMPMPGFPGTCGDPFSGGGSTKFKVIKTPPVAMNSLGPGMEGQIEVRFTPPPSPSIWQGMFDSYNAKLAIKVRDENVPPGEPKPEIVVPPASSMEPNVVGQGGMAKVAVLPGDVKFGLTTIGCYSKTYKVCVYNTGNAPLEVSDIAFLGCSPEFKKKNVPPLPQNVTAATPLCFETVYVPQEEGEKSCLVQIKSSDTSSPSLTVGMSGAGTYETEQTDEFIQVSGQDVDVLFIIDDSGSMCEEQDRLVANFDDFIKNSVVWNNNYHIGVISVNVVDANVIGKLNRGNPKVTPRYITPGPDAGAQFAKLADIGCDGNSDAQEAGLEAAQAALSAPAASDTGIKCTSDSDCQNDKNLCGDPKKCPYYCIDKTCGGWNSHFIRPEAQLEMIVLSDEEDQSSAAPSFYIDFFKNIKGFYNSNMMHYNSIVGSSGGCTAGDGGTAAEGKRYHMVSQETNGIIGSICDMDFSKTMNEIGKVAFGLKVQFFLTRLADPPTVKVWVDGGECASGWQYDAPSNSVIFDDKGSCMPQPGQVIRIHYKTLCLTS
ncbi:MAG: choice-of-anchor D domain-containing protein [Deltaproteobacteria bacterium]|nr:choice-of-anchor D domain-containing protein [Deltaproteobacteria bacterium]